MAESFMTKMCNLLVIDTRERLCSLKTKIAHIYIVSNYLCKMSKLLSVSDQKKKSKMEDHLKAIKKELNEMFEDLNQARIRLDEIWPEPGVETGVETITKLITGSFFTVFQKKIWQFNRLANQIAVFLKRTQIYLHSINDSMPFASISSATPTFSPEVISKKHSDIVKNLLSVELEKINSDFLEFFGIKKDPDNKTKDIKTEFAPYSELGGIISIYPEQEEMEMLKKKMRNRDIFADNGFTPGCFLISGPYWNMEIPRYMPMYAHEMAHAKVVNQLMKIWKKQDLPSKDQDDLYEILDGMYEAMDCYFSELFGQGYDIELPALLEECLADLVSLITAGPCYLHALFLYLITTQLIDVEIKFYDIKLRNIGHVGLIRLYILTNFCLLTLDKYPGKKQIIANLEKNFESSRDFLLKIIEEYRGNENKFYIIFNHLFAMAEEISEIFFIGWEKLRKRNQSKNFDGSLGFYTFLDSLNQWEQQLEKQGKSNDISAILEKLITFDFRSDNHEKEGNQSNDLTSMIIYLMQRNLGKERILGLNLLWLCNMERLEFLEFPGKKQGERSEDGKRKNQLIEGRVTRFFEDLVKFWVMLVEDTCETNDIKKIEKKLQENGNQAKIREKLSRFLDHYSGREAKELILLDFVINKALLEITNEDILKYLHGTPKSQEEEKQFTGAWFLGDYDCILINNDFKGRSEDNLIIKLYNKLRESGENANGDESKFCFQAFPIVADKIRPSKTRGINSGSSNIFNDNRNKENLIYVFSRVSLKKALDTFELLDFFLNHSEGFKIDEIYRSTSWDTVIFIWAINLGNEEKQLAEANERFNAILHFLNKDAKYFIDSLPGKVKEKDNIEKLISSLNYTITSFGFNKIMGYVAPKAGDVEISFDSRTIILLDKNFFDSNNNAEKKMRIQVSTDVLVFEPSISPKDSLESLCKMEKEVCKCGGECSVKITSGFNTFEFTKDLDCVGNFAKKIFENFEQLARSLSENRKF